MAKPRIFVSSTYYDLKHLRSSLENFVESLGFESVLSEKGDIAYAPDMPLDESCYREVRSADIFILIIGGRYGSEASDQSKKPSSSFFDRYDSITMKEYKNALERDVPTYILIDRSVHSEYRTFLKNKKNKNIRYAHVDSVNIFHLIEEILSQPKNNPVFSFERYAEIEGWLREQWAGLFKELLARMSSQQQIKSLSTKVAELGEINMTLRRYLETIIEKVSPKESENIIELENKRLREMQMRKEVRKSPFIDYLVGKLDFPFEESLNAIQKAKSFNNLFALFCEIPGLKKELFDDLERVMTYEEAQDDINKAREILGMKLLVKKKSKRAIDTDKE